MALEIHPIATDRKSGEFDLFEDLVLSAERNRVRVEGGDVVAVSSKYVSNSQGRIVDLDGVRAYPDGKRLAARYGMPETLAEVVSRESDQVFGGIAGFVMSATGGGILAPNAGIDRSNSKKNTVIPYPSDPYRTAEQLRRKIFLGLGINAGVIITDSRLMPSRAGTVGVAVSCAGIEPVNDMRAQRDLDGSPLKVTMQATADGLATVANHAMGEGAESRPYAIIKNSGARLTGRRISAGEVAVARDQCVYARSMKNDDRAQF